MYQVVDSKEALKTCQPYGRYNEDSFFYLALSPDKMDYELHWHKHECLRSIYVVHSGCGWRIQFNNKDPINLYEGDLIHVPKGIWHKLIPGKENVVLKITEFDDEIV